MSTQSDELLNALRKGEIELQGEFLWGSNYTFLVKVFYRENIITAVYKPSRGVRPLYDFPQDSLAKREVAAYLVSEALGWQLVPPTLMRADGPFGSGSLQYYIDHDPEYHYFNFKERDIQRLRPTVLFDYVINNADRKGSHVLIAPDDHLWLIDHGICFHDADKLRTVIWDFSGEPIPEALSSDLINFQHKLVPENGNVNKLWQSLSFCLSEREIVAISRRVDRLVNHQFFPTPDPHRRQIPWPQI
ncbi:MAG: SCO1664 family protein [Chloroflexota bacterium]|nr:SCO1664 family protein [Chloroflexota bacterium]